MLLPTLLLVAPAAAATAQSKGGGTAPSGFDNFIMRSLPRDTVSIKKQIRATAAAIEAAEKARQQADKMPVVSHLQNRIKKVEIVRIKDRINVAKKENRDVAPGWTRRESPRPANGELTVEAAGAAGGDELESKRAEFADLNKKALELELQ